MTKLIVHESQLSYQGFFARPVLSLWGEARVIVSGLFDAFAPFGVTLGDFVSENSPNLGDQSVEVDMGDKGTFSFKFDQVEWSLDDFLNIDTGDVPTVLSRGVEWIRGRVAGDLFQTHLFTYAVHGVVEGIAPATFLSRLPHFVTGIGQDIGNGQILNIELDQHARAQITLDHSYSVPDGLFIQQNLIVRVDRFDYSGVLTLASNTFQAVLNALQLQL